MTYANSFATASERTVTIVVPQDAPNTLYYVGTGIRMGNTVNVNSNVQGDYKRHTNGHSKILGMSFDGYPIYGPYDTLML